MGTARAAREARGQSRVSRPWDESGPGDREGLPRCVRGLPAPRGLTLSEPSSGPSWQHRRHRKDLGSRHSVWRVLTKYVPPTFSRTHLEAAAGGDGAPADPAAAPAARGLGGPGTPPGPGLGVRPLGGPSAIAEPQRPPAAIAARAASAPRRFRA